MSREEHRDCISVREHERILDELKECVLRDAELAKAHSRHEVEIAVLKAKVVFAAAIVALVVQGLLIAAERLIFK